MQRSVYCETSLSRQCLLFDVKELNTIDFSEAQFAEGQLRCHVVEAHTAKCVLVHFSQLLGHRFHHQTAKAFSTILWVDLQGMQGAKIVPITPRHQLVLLIEGTQIHVQIPEQFEFA